MVSKALKPIEHLAGDDFFTGTGNQPVIEEDRGLNRPGFPGDPIS
jgi:hypothetical protein